MKSSLLFVAISALTTNIMAQTAGFASNTSAIVTPPSMANATMPMATDPPMVTVTYYDPDCACHKTTTTTSCTAGPATTYTYFDTECGCTKTAMAPVPTMAAGSNYTAPAAAPMPPSVMASGPASPIVSAPSAVWTGAAVKASRPGVAAFVIFAAFAFAA